MLEILAEAAKKYPAETALLSGKKRLTFQELSEWAEGIAIRLKWARVSKGERVGLILSDDWQELIFMLALMRIGAVACPISHRFPLPTLKELLHHISCKFYIAPEGTPPIDPDIFDSDKRYLDAYAFFARNFKASEPTLSLDQPATILFTSGSSGTPKAVLHSYGNHYWSAQGSNENIPLERGDRWLLSLPLYHVSGMGIIFRCLLSGATLVIPQREESLEEAILKYQITHLSLVTTQLYRLLQKEDLLQRLKTIKAILLGGSAFPSSLLDQAYQKGLPIHTSYGLTEMASQVATTPSDLPENKRGTSGKVLPCREICIAEDGEILVRGKTLFQGYVDGEKIDRPLTKEGWFPTGDLGEIDAEGYLSVQGRKDNLFISGGENIHPEEIELALSNLAGIEQSRVVPIADKEFGYRPVAFLKTTQPFDPKKIRSELEKTLPRFKIPITFYAWPNTENAGIKTGRSYFIELARQLKS